MPHLVIEYATGGKRPGYRFRPPVDGIDEATRSAVWRHAMPRGQGWGAEGFAGARSLKCFPVGRGAVAVSTICVTDQADELGRRGIRRAEVELLPAAAYPAFLEQKLAAIPAPIREAASHQLMSYLWQRIVDRALLRGSRCVVLTAPYTGPEGWQHIEALILRLVTSPGIRMFEGWGVLTPFTTLALDWRDEGQIVGVPSASLRRGRGASIIGVNP